MKQGSRDFKTGLPIDVHAYMEDAIDIHHIFPRHWCDAHDIEPWIANTIVNKTALDAHTNRRIGGNAPSVYLSRIESGDGIERHVLDGFLRTHDIDPLALRRDDFAQFFNQRFESQLRQVERAMGKPVNRRPDRGESPFAEGDVTTHEGPSESDRVGRVRGGGVQVDGPVESAYRIADEAITWSVIKTIAAFLNTNGGTLLVGVDDDGPTGWRREGTTRSSREGDRDGWELSLTTAVKNALGAVAVTDLAVGFSTLEDRTIARIDIRPGAEAVSPRERASSGSSSLRDSTTPPRSYQGRRCCPIRRSTGQIRTSAAGRRLPRLQSKGGRGLGQRLTNEAKAHPRIRSRKGS